MPSKVDHELETLIRARYPIIYVVSWEEKRVEEALRGITTARGKRMFIWTVTQGMVASPTATDERTRAPLAALDFIINSTDPAVFVVKDFHAFISETDITRRLRDLTFALKTSYKTLVILSPILKLPPELEKEVTVVDYSLPTLEDLDRLLENIIQSVKANTQIDTQLEPAEREHLLEAALGLTANEAENVFARSLVEKRAFDVDIILSEKEQIIRKSGTLEYFRAQEGFQDVGGLDVLKDWMRKRTQAFGQKARDFGLPAPKGILLLGVQGCGKSLSCKAVASQWRLPLLRLDVGKIFSGIVGSSEENMRRAIRMAESIAPCVAGSTRVVKEDGSEETIEALYDGETSALRVLAMTDDWRLAPVDVRAITRRPAPDLYTVRLKHTHLQATGNHLHPVLRDGRLEWVRTDTLRCGDHVAIAARIPTGEAPPSTLAFLPPDTRLYGEGMLSRARPEARTPKRRFAARRGSDRARIDELDDVTRETAFRMASRFAQGRGGTADSTLHRLPSHLNQDVGYLLGLIASDGFIQERGRIGFTNTDLTLHQRFAQILNRQFAVQPVLRLNDACGKNSRLRGTGEGSVFQPCYTSYADQLLLTRILRNVETRLLSMPSSFLAAWLRGYFDGDGYVAGKEALDPKIVLTAKRAHENQRVRAVMLRLGFPTSNPASSNIEVSGTVAVRRFISEIGSDHPCRRERMEAWLERAMPRPLKDRNDPIPVGSLLREARRSVGMASHRFRSASSSLINRYERGQAHPNRARLRGIAAEIRAWGAQRGVSSSELDAIERLLNGAVAWSPVLSVSPETAPAYVYDLACGGNFIANGAVTHNCVLWLDELEKGFAGTQSSPFSDGGTTSRVFASFLTWLQEKTSPVFVVATANDIESLPPELLRKGRFDEIFFVDLPSHVERREIFAIHIRKRKRDPAQFDLDALAEVSEGFSGAEIEQAIVSALYDAFDAGRDINTEDLIRNVTQSVPLSRTMRERIAELREWAVTRARPASAPLLAHKSPVEEKLEAAPEPALVG